MCYNWPGNVRELENTLEYMMVAAGADLLLTPRHLPETFGAPVELSPRRTLPSAGDAVAALERNGASCGRTAAELGLSRHQLYRLLKRYGTRSDTVDP